jgi:hypothetical protein
MKELKLNDISITKNGKRIEYNYVYSKNLNHFFSAKNPYYVEYDQDINEIPESLLVIPFLSNIMPMSWFVGFDVYLKECDYTFYNSLKILKSQFLEFFPENDLGGTLYVENLVDNTIDGNNTSLLFSGGLDSYDSLIRNIGKNPYLISIHGADVKINDKVRWEKFVRFNGEENILDPSRLFYVESNLREFYTYKVDLLTDLGWWGGIQHGMALLGVLAPISYKYGITDIRIAASATHEVSYSWGSSPKIDENMKWANTHVTHDGYDQRRTDKIDNVVDFVNRTGEQMKLRVCYADERVDYNCSKCHKCQRTILSLILSNANPKDYGFDIPPNFYDLIFKNFHENAVMTVGIKYQWTCLQDKAKTVDQFFAYSDREYEKSQLKRFADLNLDETVNKNAAKVKKQGKHRLALREKFPLLYKTYQKIKKL